MATHPLLADGMYRTTIRTRVSQYSRSWAILEEPLPTEDLYSAANELTAKAIETYDPSRAGFQTHLWTQLGRLRDVAIQVQKHLLRHESELSGDCGHPDENIYHWEGSLLDRSHAEHNIENGLRHLSEIEEELYYDDLTEDGVVLAEFLIARGLRRGGKPTPESIRRKLGWTRVQAEEAWDEVGRWLKRGGRPYNRHEATEVLK